MSLKIDAADERARATGIENRQKILGERIVRVKHLADDRGGGCRKQCDADRSEEESDRAAAIIREVVAPQVDVAAVKTGPLQAVWFETDNTRFHNSYILF